MAMYTAIKMGSSRLRIPRVLTLIYYRQELPVAEVMTLDTPT
jgi:hypothetical protein